MLEADRCPVDPRLEAGRSTRPHRNLRACGEALHHKLDIHFHHHGRLTPDMEGPCCRLMHRDNPSIPAGIREEDQSTLCLLTHPRDLSTVEDIRHPDPFLRLVPAALLHGLVACRCRPMCRVTCRHMRVPDRSMAEDIRQPVPSHPVIRPPDRCFRLTSSGLSLPLLPRPTNRSRDLPALPSVTRAGHCNIGAGLVG